MKKQLSILRDELNKLIATEGINSKKVLALSKEIDKIILEYYEESISTSE